MLITAKDKRKMRSSYQIKRRNKGDRPVIYVNKSNKNIYAQIIDFEGNVLVSVSSKSQEMSGKLDNKTGVEIAKEIGNALAKKALEANIKDVVFNKGPYIYIGRVKALAEGAREAGLNF